MSTEAQKASAQAYRERNREKVKESKARYRERNRMALREAALIFHKENRKAIAVKKRAYYLANLAAFKAKATERRKMIDPVEAQSYRKTYYRNNKQRFLAYNAKSRAVKKSALVGKQSTIAQWMKSWKAKRSVRCFWCNGTFHPSNCHADHMIALHNGGAHCVENMAIACSACNLRKNAKRIGEWNAVLAEPILL